MRLPFLLYPNPAVNAMHKQTITFFACLPPKLQRQTNPCRHSNPPSRINVPHSQFRVLSTHLLGLLKQYSYALPRNLLNIGLLIHLLNQTTSKARFNYITLAPKGSGKFSSVSRYMATTVRQVIRLFFSQAFASNKD